MQERKPHRTASSIANTRHLSSHPTNKRVFRKKLQQTMQHKAIVISLCLALSLPAIAQHSKLFVPINVQRAISKGTRTTDGKPGPKYFQNRSDYRIKASFDPKTALLKGEETVTYTNNSPDTLRSIVLRLYPNLFKPEALRQVEVSAEDLNQGVAISSLLINGEPVSNEKIMLSGTIAAIPAPNSINPSSSVTLEMKWEVQLPNKTQLRMGRIDSTTYFVGYWYPQVAVYDDINGWSIENHTGLQEFYNDYCSFDVSISLPKGSIAWATGELQNGSAIFSDKTLKRIEKAGQSEDVVKVISSKDLSEGTVLKKNAATTWHFKANNVPDFAFGVSDHYEWDATSVEVDSLTHRRALVSATYKAGTTEGHDVASIAQHTIYRLSNTLIGIPYPYPHMTVFEGFDGMEFPMMCNDGSSANQTQKVFVTSHEVSHSYFPFMVGTNETLYAWIDEGLVTFIPKAVEMEYGNDNAHYYIPAYAKRNMGTINDIPLSVPSTNLVQPIYMMQNYGRAAAGFYFLNDMLGSSLFSKVMKEYVARWESKHPTPTDLYFTLKSVTGKDYSWYWNSWFYNYGYADLALENVKIDGNRISLTVEKKGELPVPVKLTFEYADGTQDVVYMTAEVWKDSSTFEYAGTSTKALKRIVLGAKSIPEATPKDNIYINE